MDIAHDPGNRPQSHASAQPVEAAATASVAGGERGPLKLPEFIHVVKELKISQVRAASKCFALVHRLMLSNGTSSPRAARAAADENLQIPFAVFCSFFAQAAAGPFPMLGDVAQENREPVHIALATLLPHMTRAFKHEEMRTESFIELLKDRVAETPVPHRALRIAHSDPHERQTSGSPRAGSHPHAL